MKAVEVRSRTKYEQRAVVELKWQGVIVSLTFNSDIAERPMGIVCKRLLGRLLLTFAIGLLCLAIGAKAYADVPRRMLILHGTNTLIPGNVIVERMIRETISGAAPQPIDFDSEAFDAQSLANSNYESAFASLLRQKYRDRKFDIVMTVQTPALDFVLKHRSQLWPNAAVVFLGVSEGALGKRSLGRRITGVAGSIDFAGTLGLAFRLQPNANRVVVVSGVTETDQAWIPLVRNALRPFEGQVKVTYLTNHSLPEILKTVSTLPRDTVVLYTSMFQDADGQTTIPRDVIIQLASVSAAPVYGFYESFMGLGIVGGSMTNFDRNAQRIGKLIARILAGENPDEIPVEFSAPTIPSVDWRQLKRWGLNEELLAPDTIVLFRKPALWQEYRWHILGVEAVIIIESILVIALLVQRRRRKRAESAVERQCLELAHANASLTMSEAKNGAILNALPDLMFIQTIDGVYVDCHFKDARDRLLRPENFLGKNISEVLPAHLADKFLQCFKRAAECGDPIVHEYTLPVNEQTRHFEARMVRYNDEQILTLVRDVTKRTCAEQALRENQTLLKTIMDNCPALVFLKDREGRYLYVNSRFEVLARLPPQQVLGKTDFELFSQKQAAVFRANDLKVLETGSASAFEEIAIHDDGPHTSVVYKFPLFDAGGKIYASGGIVTDITERKRIEEALRESEARFRYMADYVPTIIWIGDALGRCTYVNRQWTEFTGTVFEEQLGFGWLACVHPDDREPTKKSAEAAMRKREPFQVDYRLRRYDGQYRTVIDTGAPRFGHQGDFLGYIGGVTDITERKRVEDALRESEDRYRDVVETQTELICRNLPDTTLTFVNDAYCRYFERSREQLIGTKFLELIPTAARGAVLEHIEMLCKYPDTKASEHEHEVARPDGSVGWQRWTNHLLVDLDGRVVEMQAVGRDISDRKRAEEELKKALAEVQRLKERLEAENVYLRSEVMGVHRYGEIIGESEGIRKVLEEVGRVGGTDMTVLVLGETGTGKELVARLVHEKSGRRERPLVKVNCSALPAELIESELFGHERGAFTGAVAKQVGRFELADGGTIFLDEVGELPLRLQAKLLTVLQEGEFERLGSGKTIKVDVRVIAATNRNLSEAVQRGRFRSDLYYRLNVYPIEIPPLREHREDIGLLAEAFLQEAGRRLGKSFGKIPDEVIEALQGYSWPGNVRELENVIGRAAVTSTGLTLQLPEGWKAEGSLINRNTNLNSNAQVHSNPPVTDSNREATLGELEKAHILEVLHQTNWRIEGPKGAALILGLHPNTLRSRMRKLGIQRSASETNDGPQQGGDSSTVSTH